MSSFDPSTHRLAGSSSSEAGGLILKSSKPKGSNDSSEERKPSSSEHVFKKPSASLLGLDRLARRKREEREAEQANFPEKKARLQSNLLGSFREDDSLVRISFGKSSRSSEGVKDRKYRGPLVETPSHTGGVNEAALQRMQSRLVSREQRSHGVYASSSSSSSRDKERRGGSTRDRYVSERPCVCMCVCVCVWKNLIWPLEWDQLNVLTKGTASYQGS